MVLFLATIGVATANTSWIDSSIAEEAINALAENDAERAVLDHQLETPFDCSRFGDLCDLLSEEIAEEAVREVIWRAADGWQREPLTQVFSAHINAHAVAPLGNGFAHLGPVASGWGELDPSVDSHTFDVTDSSGETTSISYAPAEVHESEYGASILIVILEGCILPGCPGVSEPDNEGGLPLDSGDTEGETETESGDGEGGQEESPGEDDPDGEDTQQSGG